MIVFDAIKSTHQDLVLAKSKLEEIYLEGNGLLIICDDVR